MIVCWFARLPVCPFARLLVCSFARVLVCSFVCSFARLLVCSFVRLNLPACSFANLLVYRFAGLLVYRLTGLQVYRFTGLQVYRFTELQVYRFEIWTMVRGLFAAACCVRPFALAFEPREFKPPKTSGYRAPPSGASLGTVGPTGVPGRLVPACLTCTPEKACHTLCPEVVRGRKGYHGHHWAGRLAN